jgi:hypothetical protein
MLGSLGRLDAPALRGGAPAPDRRRGGGAAESGGVGGRRGGSARRAGGGDCAGGEAGKLAWRGRRLAHRRRAAGDLYGGAAAS